jgi:glutaryl-CoA dehydrogenase
MRSTASVQGSLVMFPIYKFGSEEQKMKYLPKLATGELMGCFGLTEPDHGSNPAGMLSNFKDAGDHVILNGSKMWISNAPFADIAVVWAKNEQGEIQGLVVERGMEGFSTPETHGKWSLRASATGELVFRQRESAQGKHLPHHQRSERSVDLPLQRPLRYSLGRAGLRYGLHTILRFAILYKECNLAGRSQASNLLKRNWLK